MYAAVYFLTKWERLIAIVAMFIGVGRFTVIRLQYNEAAAIAGTARTAIVPAAGQDVRHTICLKFIGYIFTSTNYQDMVTRYVSITVQYNCLLTPRMREPVVPLQRTRVLLGAVVTVSLSPTRNEELYSGSYEIANTIQSAHLLPPSRT